MSISQNLWLLFYWKKSINQFKILGVFSKEQDEVFCAWIRLHEDCMKIEWRIHESQTQTHKQTHRATSWAPVGAKNKYSAIIDEI